MMSRGGGVQQAVGLFAFCAGLVGVTLQLTVGDAAPLVAPLFFLLPWPVCAVLFAASAWCFSTWIPRVISGGAAIAAAGLWLSQSYGVAPPATSKWKAITWNLGRPSHPSQHVIEVVRTERPDVMVLVESGEISPAMARLYEDALPGYRVVPEVAGLACIVRGECVESSLRELMNGSRVARFVVKMDGARLNVYVVDIGADPLLPRRPQIELLAAVTGGQPRTLLMGDFNTPLESKQLATLRAGFVEAREGPCRGFRETWFYNLPLLSLDHVWLSRDLRPVFSECRPGFESDHGALIVNFGLAE